MYAKTKVQEIGKFINGEYRNCVSFRKKILSDTNLFIC